MAPLAGETSFCDLFFTWKGAWKNSKGLPSGASER